MPKKLTNKLIRCVHFTWRLYRRSGQWYADGRSNSINVGRHSLGTHEEAEAVRLLAILDEACAVKHGLIARRERPLETQERLTIAEGRKLYEQHIDRPRVTGGAAPATKKRYRSTFNMFVPWADKSGLLYCDQIDAATLNKYARHRQELGRAPKTQANDLTTIKQCVCWLIEEGRMPGCEPIKLKLRKIESRRAYCYRTPEVAAMVEHCRATDGLDWLGDVIVGLACTGMRIAELTGLRWSDVDLGVDGGRITLTDETGFQVDDAPRRTLKSGRSRSLPIQGGLPQVLQQMPRTSPYVFLGPTQRPLKPDYVRRKFVEHVINPLASKFPAVPGRQGFTDGRLHSFRHYFVSYCAAKLVPELVVMEWVGHADSAMVRHYFHLSDEESRRYMNSLDFLGGVVVGRSDGNVSKS